MFDPVNGKDYTIWDQMIHDNYSQTFHSSYVHNWISYLVLPFPIDVILTLSNWISLLSSFDYDCNFESIIRIITEMAYVRIRTKLTQVTF